MSYRTITDKTGHSGKVTGRDLTQYLTGKRDALFVRRFDLAEEVAAQVRTALAKADFHTPGGKEHDQKVHAGDDAAPSETDPKAARVAAAILRKLSPYEAQHRLFRPKQGVDHRAEYDNTVVALHAALTNAGYEVESTQSGRSSSELTKMYRNDEGRIKIEGGSRQIEAQPNMPSA